ncbi:MAG: hypothetical protein GX092_05075 [Clostridia bacterium]|nr:hypothetical protein [Clostridia bacterium]
MENKVEQGQGQRERIVEAYVGEYASGKSEVALNRALNLVKKGHKPVTLVDFDLVEPFYTLRPLKRSLEEKGVQVLAWETEKTMGLGEAGMVLKPEIRWALKREGDIIIDVGYGVAGARKLRLLEDAREHPELRVFVVINIARPLTSDVKEIVDYIKTLGTVHGVINNSHWGDDTTIEIIQEGAKVVTKAANLLGLPVIATTVEQRFSQQIANYDLQGNPVVFLERQMNRYYW